MKAWTYEPAADLGLPLHERLSSLRRECGLASTLSHLAWWSCVKTYLAFGHRLRVEGLENLPPRPPMVVVANHSSHLDALVLGSMLPVGLRPRMYPIAAKDFFFSSAGRSVVSAFFLNALPVPRQSVGPRALRTLRRRLTEEGCVYIIFPEGTRSRTGEMACFKPGLGMLVAGTDAAVVPCYLKGAHHAFPPDRSLPRLTPLRLRIGTPLRFGDRPHKREGWRSIAADTERAVQALGAEMLSVGTSRGPGKG
jgi:1-acyl-sn-glycerol-3-phosphate acyltransferase